jgi:putative hydrolase of the HAD superfamily
MIQLITFDLDNTLWDSDPVILSAEQACWDYLKRHYEKISGPFTKLSLRKLKFELINELPALSHKVSEIRIHCLKQALLRCGYSEQTAINGSLEAFKVFITERQQVTFYPNTIKTLTQLAKRYRLAALTNGNAHLNDLGLNMFEFGYNAEDFAAAKPAPDLFEAALRTTNLAPQQVLHIGDHPEHDVLGAYQLGMHTLWFNQHQKPWQRKDCHPNLEVSHLEALPALINQYNATLSKEPNDL